MDLNTILIILGIVALIALVAHGLWANRREKSQYFENAKAFAADAHQSTSVPPASAVSVQTVHQKQADNHGEQAVQNVSHTVNSEQYVQETAYSQAVAAGTQPEYPTQTQSIEQIKIRLPENQEAESQNVVYQMRADEYPQSQKQAAEQDITSVTIADIEANVDEEEGITTSVEQLRVQLQEAAQTPAFNQSPLSPPPLQQPVETHPPVEEKYEQEEEQNVGAVQEPSFIMLYVVAAENSQFHGSELSQALEELGFIFGKGSIYHRHLDLSVASPVLFSAANINQPGTFDLYRLTEFYTVGIALFMQLPSEGNDRANLKMMIRAAKTLAEQLNGFVLTERQALFTEQAEQEYLARVK